MAANINFNQEKKTNSFVSAKVPAWHGLGTILPDKFTSEDAIKYANLDYRVELAPVYAKFNNDPDPAKRGVLLDDYACTFRTDNKQTFAVVGKKYEVVQNTEAFKFFDSVVGEGKAIYETAGALGQGEVVFITAKFPDYIVLPGDDITEKYLMICMSHDATKSITALFTPTRVVCANTLAMALSNGSHRVVIKHTASAHDRLKEAAKVMGIVNTLSKDMTELLTKLTRIKITDSKLDDYLEKVFLSNDELKKLAEDPKHDFKNAGVSTQKLKTMDYIHDFYNTGIGQNTVATKGTLFGAYSAVTGYMFNVKEYRSEDSRLNNLIFEGADYKINSHALRTARELIPVWS